MEKSNDVQAQKLSVWVDNDLCTGGGLCLETAPEVFAHNKEGICCVKDGTKLVSGPEALVVVAPEHHDKVMQAADDCPGECIFIEIE